MEAKQIYLFPLIVVFLLFSFSLQAQSSDPTIEKTNEAERRRAAFKGVIEAVGPPNYAAEDHAEWMLRAVGFVMEKMNWTYHFNGDDKPDVKLFNRAKGCAFQVVLWIIERLKWNPYRPYYGFAFFYTFYYIDNLEKENPVYPCFKAVWPACIARAPATPEGEVVYRFECAWKFNKKCRKKWGPLYLTN